MGWSLCLLVFGAVLIGCGLAVFWAVRQITESEISPPDSPEDPEPRIITIPPQANRTPWKDAETTIALDAAQQAELLRIYREEYVEQCVWPEMPLLAFLRSVEDHQRPDKPIEVELLFAQRHLLRSFAEEHSLGWLRYAIDRAIERKELGT